VFAKAAVADSANAEANAIVVSFMVVVLCVDRGVPLTSR